MADRPDGDRTLEPTPRRLADARRRGEVVRSRDLSGAVALAAVFTVLAVGASGGVGRVIAYLRAVSASAPGGGDAVGALGRAVGELAAALALPLGAAALASLTAGLFQTRGLVTLHPLRLDPGKVRPRLERVASVAALAEAAKGLSKIAIVTVIAWATLAPIARGLASLAGARAVAVLGALAEVLRTLGFRIVLAAAALGVVDYLWQRRRHLRSLRMTREEVRREHKESEGDPRHKAERQRLHRELLEQRMLADVRKADFVVVNPDHIAVALRYDRDGDAAPVVIAKGERLLAEKIKEVAREAGVPVFRDVALARSLRAVEEGDQIPEALYEAIAEILRVVYESSPAEPPPTAPAQALPPGWRRA